MRWNWTYQRLGSFTYTLLPKTEIKPFLMEWLKKEWAIDHAEAPDQSWTIEWLDLLPRMEFCLEIVELNDIKPRPDLMNYKTAEEDFMADLMERADEREISLLRGVSTEPLVVNRDGLELMDGYTRYVVFNKHNQKHVYAYVGTTAASKNKTDDSEK